LASLAEPIGELVRWCIGEVNSPVHQSTDTPIAFLRIRFLCQPIRDLLARPTVIVIQMDDQWRKRQPLLTLLVGAWLDDFVEAPEQPLEMIGHELSVLAWEMVNALVYGTERAGTTLLVEVAAEALGPARRTRADEIRKLFLFALEFRYHRFVSGEGCLIVTHRQPPNCGRLTHSPRGT
jgi:hypothetical protein